MNGHLREQWSYEKIKLRNRREGDARCVWPRAFILQSKANDRSIHLISTNNRINKPII